MRVLLLGCVLAACATGAEAATTVIPYQPDLSGQTVQCAAFKPGPDGSWVTLRAITVQRENSFTTVAPDSSFKAGGPKLIGIDVGAVLNAVCPR